MNSMNARNQPKSLSLVRPTPTDDTALAGRATMSFPAPLQLLLANGA